MRVKNSPLLLLIILSAAAIPASAQSYLSDQPVTTAPELTFTTWNIMASRLTRTSNLTAAVTDLNSDFIALQEVDFNTQRSGKNAGGNKPVDQAAMLAEAGKMNYAECKSIYFEGGQYGTALLSHWKIQRTEQIKLSNTAGTEQRTACINYITVTGIPVQLAIIITHPDQARNNALRLTQIKEILTAVSKASKTAIPVLMGDLNLVPTSTEYKELVRQMNDTLPIEGHFTYPSWNPNRRIDYILTSTAQHWKIDQIKLPVKSPSGKMPFDKLSDHLPVIVTMKLTHL